VAVEQKCGDRVVTVGEYVGLDRDAVTDDALCRESAAVDLRSDVFDDDPDSAHASDSSKGEAG
jgi:hypothetical protein